MKFKIVNGKVFDPTQRINGLKMDIFVEDGKIVNPHKSDLYKFKTSYDVNGMIVMAGAIDIHSHIAGGNVNNARLLSPEVHSNFVKKNLNGKSVLVVRIDKGRAIIKDIIETVATKVSVLITINKVCHLKIHSQILLSALTDLKIRYTKGAIITIVNIIEGIKTQ